MICYSLKLNLPPIIVRRSFDLSTAYLVHVRDGDQEASSNRWDREYSRGECLLCFVLAEETASEPVVKSKKNRYRKDKRECSMNCARL